MSTDLLTSREVQRLRQTRMPAKISVPWANQIDIELLSISLWCVAYGTKYVSRRTIPDVVADALRDYDRVGKLVNPDGTAFVVSDDIDQALGAPDCDWARNLFALPLGDSWQPNQETQERLRLLYAAVRCGGPKLWRNLMTPCSEFS